MLFLSRAANIKDPRAQVTITTIKISPLPQTIYDLLLHLVGPFFSLINS